MCPRAAAGTAGAPPSHTNTRVPPARPPPPPLRSDPARPLAPFPDREGSTFNREGFPAGMDEPRLRGTALPPGKAGTSTGQPPPPPPPRYRFHRGLAETPPPRAAGGGGGEGKRRFKAALGLPGPRGAPPGSLRAERHRQTLGGRLRFPEARHRLLRFYFPWGFSPGIRGGGGRGGIPLPTPTRLGGPRAPPPRPRHALAAAPAARDARLLPPPPPVRPAASSPRGRGQGRLVT